MMVSNEHAAVDLEAGPVIRWGAMFSGMKAPGSDAEELASSPYTEDLRAWLKREAAEVIANPEASDGAEASQREVRTAIAKMDPQLAERAAENILSSDIQGAKRTLRRELGLSAVIVGMMAFVLGVVPFTENQSSIQRDRGSQ